MGQLFMILRAKYLVDAEGYNKIQGQPFKQSELEAQDRGSAGLSSDRCLDDRSAETDRQESRKTMTTHRFPY